jgi:hypothetical protein
MLSMCAKWATVDDEISDNTTLLGMPTDMFSTVNDELYVTVPSTGHVLMWPQSNAAPTIIFSNTSQPPNSVTVSINNIVYIAIGSINSAILRLNTNNSNDSVVVATANGFCWDIFVDIRDQLYCSMADQHQIARKVLSQRWQSFARVAGTGMNGSASDMLSSPRGIFVDEGLNLFVGDCDNDRVQRFSSAQMNAVTVAGMGASDTIDLDCPSDVIVDGLGFLFIADRGNDRVVGSGSTGFRCIIGCSPATSDSLRQPSAIQFMASGSVFVTDQINHRIRRHSLINNFCLEY